MNDFARMNDFAVNNEFAKMNDFARMHDFTEILTSDYAYRLKEKDSVCCRCKEPTISQRT